MLLLHDVFRCMPALELTVLDKELMTRVIADNSSVQVSFSVASEYKLCVLLQSCLPISRAQRAWMMVVWLTGAAKPCA